MYDCDCVQQLSCVGSGNCPVTRDARKFCAACRMRRCLAVGMKLDLLYGTVKYVQYFHSARLCSSLVTAHHTSLSQPHNRASIVQWFGVDKCALYCVQLNDCV